MVRLNPVADSRLTSRSGSNASPARHRVSSACSPAADLPFAVQAVWS